jgi:hypothetical protein
MDFCRQVSVYSQYRLLTLLSLFRQSLAYSGPHLCLWPELRGVEQALQRGMQANTHAMLESAAPTTLGATRSPWEGCGEEAEQSRGRRDGVNGLWLRYCKSSYQVRALFVSCLCRPIALLPSSPKQHNTTVNCHLSHEVL